MEENCKTEAQCCYYLAKRSSSELSAREVDFFCSASSCILYFNTTVLLLYQINYVRNKLLSALFSVEALRFLPALLFFIANPGIFISLLKKTQFFLTELRLFCLPIPFQRNLLQLCSCDFLLCLVANEEPCWASLLEKFSSTLKVRFFEEYVDKLSI